MTKESTEDADLEAACYYSIRLLITHPTMSVNDVTDALGVEPDYCWNAGDREFTNDMMWGRTSSTEGSRRFFAEIHEVLVWLHEKQSFVSSLLTSGGSFQVIGQLPGTVNVGDVLESETMRLAVKLGVVIGIEVFPGLVKPMSDG